MDSSLTMHDLEFKLSICAENIVANVDIDNLGPGSFSVKFRKNIRRKITKSYQVFVIK